MNETQSLPFWLQFTVALASIFSAAAVIIYIIQTIMNARNFNKQFKISEAQTKLAKDQFDLSQKQIRYTNQGWLSIELQPLLAMAQTQPQILHASMKPGLKYREIGLNSPLENTGNTPIKIEFKSFILRVNGVEYYKRDTSTNKEGIYPPIILYPKQKIPHSYGGVTFDAKSTSLTSPEINNLNITAEFEIHYKDLNYDQIKIIHRTAKFILTDVSIAVIYTNIDDTIPE